jgi:hypothetical protein
MQIYSHRSYSFDNIFIKKGGVNPSFTHYHQMPGMIWPVSAYDPIAATIPIIAAQPLMRSARSFIVFLLDKGVVV